MHGNSNIKFCL